MREQFKDYPTEEAIINRLFDINNTTSEKFNSIQYESLLACIPPDEQLAPLLSYDGPIQELDKAEKFVLGLVKIPNIKEKLLTLIFCDRFPGRINSIEYILERARRACVTVLGIETLKDILRMTIRARETQKLKRDYLNKAASISKAPSTKQPPSIEKSAELRPKRSEPPKASLLNYFEGYINSNMEKLLPYKSQLLEVEEALRYQPELLNQDKDEIEKKLAEIDTQIQSEKEPSDMLKPYYEYLKNFLNTAKTSLDNFQTNYNNFVIQAKTYLNVIGNTESQYPVEDTYETFYHFTKIFSKIIEDNLHKEKEEKQRQQLKAIGGEKEEENGIMDRLIQKIKIGDYLLQN